MTVPTRTGESGAEVDRVRSRERAVSRVFKGVVLSGIGWAGVMAVPIADFVFGASQPLQEVWSIAARSLFWLGFVVAATAVPHLIRYGGRRGRLAFASFAGAGACGLLAVAEQFETWFLDSHVLQGLDTLGLAGAILFIVIGFLLLGRDTRSAGRDQPPASSA